MCPLYESEQERTQALYSYVELEVYASRVSFILVSICSIYTRIYLALTLP